MSGGQAQRTSIARGLFTRPRVLLLDEPFSAVDAFTRTRLQDLLARIAVDRQLTIVLVTHDIDEALHLADRVLVMDANPGTIRMDVRIDEPRPRKRNAAAVAAIKDRILDCLTPGEALSA